MECQGTKIRKRVENLRDKLRQCIETQYGLLTKLVSSDVLNMEEFEEIKSKGSSYKQCDELLDCLQGKSQNECTNFIVALNEEEQKHVVNYINQEARRFEEDHSEYLCWPLEQIHRIRITRNLDKVVRLIENEQLVAALYSRRCINYNQITSFIEMASTYIEKNEKLFSMLQRRSIRDYNVFVEVLKESEIMSSLARLFEDDVVVETVDCTTASSSKRAEQTIVSNFQAATQQEHNLISRKVHNECHPNTELAAMKDKHSIRCFFFCRTPDALQSLYISINNGSLISTMQSIFQHLLGCEESVSVVKIAGQLNLDEQKNKIEEFCTDIGSVSTTELLEELSVAAMSGFKKPFWFPYEVLEPILLQVAVKLFKVNQVRLLEPRPDITSLLTISSVCQDWFQVITGRRILRRKLKRTFRKSTVLPVELFKAAVLLRHRLVDQPMTSRDAGVSVVKTVTSVCRQWLVAVSESGDRKRVKQMLHIYNPQLLVTLDEPPTDDTGLPRPARGVFMLENCFYVVYKFLNHVKVFDCGDRYKKLKDIEVKGLKEPWDIVGSSVTSQLLISDYSDVIWRADLQTGVSDVFVKLENGIYSWLSLVENRLLMTSRDSLLMYDIQSGEKIKTIPFTGDMKKHEIRQAIESNKGSFFVCHGRSVSNETVSEIDSEGRVIRVFNNKEKVNCDYLALDSVGRLLVADGKNSRVVLLDEHLKVERILIDSKRLNNGRPFRLNYNRNNSRLAVGLENGQVKVFECKAY